MYIYETHLHTYESSACGSTKASEYPAYYKSIGYSGIFITDHFFNGNCRIPPMNDWKERINAFCRSYEIAKEAGDRIGFPVFFGWEANFDGDEFLIYGLDKNWLLEHPDLLSYTRTEQYDIIHRDGGLVVQAHPFRERPYISTIYVNPDNCDAMEAYNTFNHDFCNHNAEIYCREHGIFMTSGSDLHKKGSTEPDNLYGMIFDTPLADEKDYVHRILNRQGSMRVPDSHRTTTSVIETKTPVVINHRD